MNKNDALVKMDMILDSGKQLSGKPILIFTAAMHGISSYSDDIEKFEEISKINEFINISYNRISIGGGYGGGDPGGQWGGIFSSAGTGSGSGYGYGGGNSSDTSRFGEGSPISKSISRSGSGAIFTGGYGNGRGNSPGFYSIDIS